MLYYVQHDKFKKGCHGEPVEPKAVQALRAILRQAQDDTSLLLPALILYFYCPLFIQIVEVCAACPMRDPVGSGVTGKRLRRL